MSVIIETIFWAFRISKHKIMVGLLINAQVTGGANNSLNSGVK